MISRETLYRAVTKWLEDETDIKKEVADRMTSHEELYQHIKAET